LLPALCGADGFAPLQKIEPGDSLDAIVGKAAHVVPTPQQLAYHRNEFIAFIHFGPNTFTGREWGDGMEDPKTFAPGGLDTDQWCETIKAAGMKTVVMTFKHHDGYVLWQSRYENHQTIKNSPISTRSSRRTVSTGMVVLRGKPSFPPIPLPSGRLPKRPAPTGPRTHRSSPSSVTTTTATC